MRRRITYVSSVGELKWVRMFLLFKEITGSSKAEDVIYIVENCTCKDTAHGVKTGRYHKVWVSLEVSGGNTAWSMQIFFIERNLHISSALLFGKMSSVKVLKILILKKKDLCLLVSKQRVILPLPRKTRDYIIAALTTSLTQPTNKVSLLAWSYNGQYRNKWLPHFCCTSY
jgi:hypothetical protein